MLNSKRIVLRIEEKDWNLMVIQPYITNPNRKIGIRNPKTLRDLRISNFRHPDLIKLSYPFNFTDITTGFCTPCM